MPDASAPAAPSTVSGVRIAHVGVAVESLGALLPLYRDVLGMPEVPLADSGGARIAAVASGDALIELLEPVAPETPIGRFLARRGPGIHHICFAVPDLAAALARCRAAGIRLIDEAPRPGAEGKPIAFLHPASTGGALIELTEA